MKFETYWPSLSGGYFHLFVATAE